MSDPLTWLLLCSAALAAGFVNAVGGGGTLLTFPALMAALIAAGVEADAASVTANQTSTVALVVGSVAGCWGYRSESTGAGRWVRLLLPSNIAGGIAGALLLVLAPAATFKAVVPWLILGATTLLAVQPYVTPAADPNADADVPLSRPTAGAAIVFQFVIAVYGGYFGAGIGILMLANFAMVGVGDIHKMNALKAGFAACINGVSVLVFVTLPLVTGDPSRIHWPFGGAMAAAAIAGGTLGAATAMRLDKNLVRRLVVGIGFALSGYYLYREFVR